MEGPSGALNVGAGNLIGLIIAAMWGDA